MLVRVGSTNPVKVRAGREAVSTFNPNAVVEGIRVESDVSPMPMSKEEIRKGARTRALRALEGALIGIGMEGGMTTIDGDHYLASSVYACTASEGAWGGEVLVKLPPQVVELVLEEKMELGTAIDTITGTEGTKRKGGAVAFLTGGRLTRMQVFRDATIMALAPILTKQ